MFSNRFIDNSGLSRGLLMASGTMRSTGTGHHETPLSCLSCHCQGPWVSSWFWALVSLHQAPGLIDFSVHVRLAHSFTWNPKPSRWFGPFVRSAGSVHLLEFHLLGLLVQSPVPHWELLVVCTQGLLLVSGQYLFFGTAGVHSSTSSIIAAFF